METSTYAYNGYHVDTLDQAIANGAELDKANHYQP